MSRSRISQPDLVPVRSLPRYVEMVRVSSKGQADRDTPENQRRALDRLRDARPGALVERIEAPGISGALDFAKRPDLVKLKVLTEARAFDEIRVFDIDRLTRHDDPRERFIVYGMALDAGAVIVDVKGQVTDPSDESGMGEIDFYLRTMFAARERKKIRDRTLAGRKRFAEAGKFAGLGTLPWWLTWDKAAKTIQLVPDRAAVVIKAGDLLLDGHSLAEVCRRLLDDGHPPPKGKQWYVFVLSRMLSNRALLGEWSQGLSGEQYPIAVPPVAKPTWFERVQVAILARQAQRPRGSYTFEALCRGHVVCALCGKAMHVRRVRGRKRKMYTYYSCPSDKKGYRCVKGCGNVNHRAELVDQVVWEEIRALALDEDVRRAAIEVQTQDTGNDERELGVIEKRLATLMTAEVWIGRQVASGLMTEGASEKLLAENAKTRASLEAQLAVLRRRVEEATALRGAAATIADKIKAISHNIDRADFATRREILDALVPNVPGFGVMLGARGEAEIRGAFPVGDGAGGERLSMSPPRSGPAESRTDPARPGNTAAAPPRHANAAASERRPGFAA